MSEKDELNSKVIVSLQIPKYLYDFLKIEAENNLTSVSYLIRDLLLNHYKERGSN